MNDCKNLICVENFINGVFTKTDKYLNSNEPATGKIWAKIPASTAKDANSAVEAAKCAFPKWSSTPINERSQIVLKIANLLEDNLNEFAEAESRDQGKPLYLSKTVDIPRAILNFRHFATAYKHVLNTSSLQQEYNNLNYTLRFPFGVAGLITPWNLPLYLLTFKIAPAIIAGNTVVCKPSELTSVTAWMLCSLFVQAGLPPGVVNMVFGYGKDVGDALVEHPDVPIISFTGSTVIGTQIYSKAAPNFKKLSLELGGKNAAIIFNDADLKKCISTTIRSSFTNQGEVCLSTSRIFVQKKLYYSFLKLFVDETRKLKVGPYKEDYVIVGALISEQHLNKVKSYVQTAVAEGATVHCGWSKDQLILPEANKNGYFMLPTVLADVSDESKCMQEEIFGPVTCIVPFVEEAEVVKRVNNVKYGLCASVWTSDSSRLHRIAHQLEVGTVWSNCWMVRNLDMPFGGCKHSGIGREGTHESLDFYTQLKTVYVQM
uniref:Aldehyde dehydrogenase domain-containing protein n=1 Tax=Strigamia maritima TaxID=126957 RepID=T1IV25_STRMM